MKTSTYKKYIVLITYTMVLAFIMFHIKDILGVTYRTFKILSPLWIGIALAFTLNVPMSIIEREVFGKSDKKIRILSLSLSIMIILLLVIILFAWVIPDFISSATYLLGQVPILLEELNEFLMETFRNTDLSSYLRDFSASNEITSLISNVFKALINNFSAVLSNFASTIVNLVTGIIIAIYFLLEKEKILGAIDEILKNIFDKNKMKKIKEVTTVANKSFHDFITYQCLECLILGLIMFLAFVAFGFPYSLTIAFLTTITAIVPIFGAFIACLIGAILIGTVSIKQAIIFVVVFQVIQQIENNIIYPKVVGSHVGLPPVVTIIALLIGGNVAGLTGMILCIPLTSIFLSLFWSKIHPLKDENTEKKKHNNKRVASKAA